MLDKIKELIFDSFAFFILSALIMSPMEIIGGEYSREVNAIFMESIAPRSIMGLFVVSTMSAALIMFFFGKHCTDKKVNHFLYEHIVYKVTKFGMSFAAAGTGMLAGLAVAATINSEYKVTAAGLLTTFIFVCYWALFSAINYSVKNGFGTSISSKATRFLLLVAFVGAPTLYAFSYEPAEECGCEQSANKQSQQDSADGSPLL